MATVSRPASSRERSSRSVASFVRRATCSRIWRQELVAGRVVEIRVVEQLEEAAEREERRAQLVRGVGDELAAGAVEVREAQPHALEGARQLAELVRAVIDDGLVEAPLGDPLGRGLEPADPPGEQARAGVPEAATANAIASAPATNTRLRTTRDRLQLVVQRRREQHRPVADADTRPRRRSGRGGVTVPRASVGAADRVERDRVVLDVGSNRVSVAESATGSSRAGVVARAGREDDPRAFARGATVSSELLLEIRLDREVRERDRAAATTRARCSSVFSSDVLVRRDDDQVDDREHAGDDDQEREREPAARRSGAGSPVAEAVADAAHGQDVLGRPRLGLELLAQMADVDVDRARIAVVGALPERLEQHPPAEDPARVRRERAQQLELDVRELHRLAAHLDDRGGARRSRGRRARSAPRRLAPGAWGARARRSSARTRERNSRIENGFVM